MVTANHSLLPASSLLGFQHNGKDAIVQPNGILELGVPSYSEVARVPRHVLGAMQIVGTSLQFPTPQGGDSGDPAPPSPPARKKED